MDATASAGLIFMRQTGSVTSCFHAFWSLKSYNANLAATTYITVVNVSTSN